ncbi:hypothetical protein PMAYCL1PPCAC_05241, partial [Pristionchus mayeri]
KIVSGYSLHHTMNDVLNGAVKGKRSRILIGVLSVFSFASFVAYMDVASFKMMPARFMHYDNAEPIENNATSSPRAVFRKRPEVAHIDCARLLHGDTEYMKEIAKERPTLSKNDSLE